MANTSTTELDLLKSVSTSGGVVDTLNFALPAGSATSAKQDTSNTSLASIDSKITAVNTGAVVVASSALPSGAATATLQGTANTSLASIDGKITACNTGAVTVSSIPVIFKTRADNYINTGNGTTVNVAAAPIKYFGVQVKAVGTITAWDVRLEGSLDGTNFSQILQHTNTTGDGVVLWSGSSAAPCLYFRSRCAGLTLGLGTEIDVTILGME